MSDAFDVSGYLSVFLDEADEQLQELNQDILILEKNGDDKDTIQKIFRAAHTLKGSSGAMGFHKMRELTHAMENVLDRIRKGEVYVSSGIITLLFECLDMLKCLKEDISAQNKDERDINQLLGKLGMAENGQMDGSKPEELSLRLDENSRQLIKEGLSVGFRALAVYIRIVPDCQMKSIRAYLVANNLREIGEIITSIPGKEELDNDKFGDSFIYVALTQENETKIISVVNSVSEILAVSIKEIKLDELDIPSENSLREFDFNSSKKEAGNTVDNQYGSEMRKMKVSQVMRVDVDKIDSMMNLIGELVINQTRVAQLGGMLKSQFRNNESVEDLLEVALNTGRIVVSLQESVMKVRMLPIEQLFNRLPRVVRDLSIASGKKVSFLVEGKDTELDRTLIEEISDPLIHLLRNSVDHGIEEPVKRIAAGKPEEGTVRIAARHKDNMIEVTVEDDGKGINPVEIKEKAIKKGIIKKEEADELSDSDALNLIFKPGFSTAETVTEVSGRGVGMDIVRSHIEKMNGVIDIVTEVGKGSRFIIKLPLTLAIIPSLLVKVNEHTLAVSLSNVMEIVRINKSEVSLVNKREAVVIRGRVLPLVRLHDRFGGIKTSGGNRKNIFIVVVGSAEKRIGLVLDQLIGNQDVVIKTLGKFIGKVKGVSGATILGDGKIALIPDIGYIIRQTVKKME